MTAAELAAKIKAKYPDYAQIPDNELVSKITAKYPEYKSQLSTELSTPPQRTPTPEAQDQSSNLGYPFATNPAPGIQALGRFASNAAGMMNPVAIAQGIGGMIAHPMDNIITPMLREKIKADEAARTGQRVDSLNQTGHEIAGAVPVVGPLAASVVDTMMKDPAAGLGQLTGGALAGRMIEAVPAAIPPIARGVAEYTPPALAALKAASNVKARILSPTVGEAAAAGAGYAMGGPAGAKIAYGLMKAPKVIKAGVEGFKGKMAEQAAAKAPPAETAVEVPASSLDDLVQKAVPEAPAVEAPKPPKFTHEAARDAAIELFNNNVPMKEAPALLRNSFENVHPDVAKAIIKEEYKKLLDKATGKPVEPMKAKESPAASTQVPEQAAPPAPPSPPEYPAPAQPPAVSGRRWQQENPNATEAQIDAQTAANFSKYKEGSGNTARDWIKKYNASDAPGRREMIRGLSGKLNYEDMRQLAAYTEDITSENPAKPPSVSSDNSSPLKFKAPALEALKTQADIATGLNNAAKTLAEQIKNGSIEKTRAIDSLVSLKATRQYAIAILEKALKDNGR